MSLMGQKPTLWCCKEGSALLGYSDNCDLPLNFHPVANGALADVSLIRFGMIGWKGFDRMVVNKPMG